MTRKQLGTLNSLVTFAVENVPGGPNEDEQEVARIVGAWLLALDHNKDKHCPHCGDPMPYGDERTIWLGAHLDSPFHRWWWGLRKFVEGR